MSITLHTALTHLEKRNTYVRIMLIDYSSAFNTRFPSKLVTKLGTLGLPDCRPQVKRVGNIPSATLTPQGCKFSPLLFTHDFPNTIINFAEDTTVVGLITGDDETGRRSVTWKCGAGTTTAPSTSGRPKS
jgi:gmma-aminobutyric acid receptor subunit gamma/cGMP-dependent protein kinase 2